MAAAYPYLDDFLPANDLASLERLGELLTPGGRDSDVAHRCDACASRPAAAGVAGSGRP